MKLDSELVELGITRRELLRHTGAAGFIATGTPFLPYVTLAARADETPQYGGILSINFPTDPPNFDPISNSTSRALHVVAPCCNKLVQFDPLDSEAIIGDLAEKWTVSEDGLTYDFSLLKGVRFHDGAPMTSADVKFTFDFVRNPPEGVVSIRKDMLSMVQSIEALDEHTVRMVLGRPSSAFLAVLANGWMVVLPKHILERDGHMREHVVGTGPFKLKASTPGVSVELERNPDYHIPGRPYLDGITFYIIKDPSTANAYFRTGQLLIYDHMNGNDGRLAEQELPDKVKLLGGPGLGFAEISLNVERRPWDDVRVRRAVSLAIDREEGLKVLYQGDGAVGGLMPPVGRWALAPEKLEQIPGFGKDIEANRAEARRLMQEAGYPDGLKTTLTARRTATVEAYCVFIQEQLRRVGIDSTIDLQEDAVIYENAAKRNFDISPWLLSAAGGDPEQIFGEYYTCNSGNNFSGVCIPELDQLFLEQSRTQDPDARKQIVEKMELLALNEVSRVMVFWRSSFHGHSLRVHNFRKYVQDDDFRQFQDAWLSPA